jgi:serine phosphatase RsbU (regulator of sigma subunit)
MSEERTEAMEAPCEAAWSLRYSDPDAALEKAEEAIRSAGSGNERQRLQAELVRSFVRFLHHGEKEVYPDVHALAKAFRDRDRPREAAIAHDLLARIADAYGEYGQGTEEVLKGLDLLGERDEPELKGELHATKGNLLNRTGDHESGIAELERALAFRKELGDGKAIASALNLLGRSYTLKGDPEKGLSYYQEALELRQRSGDEGALPWTLLGMGTALETAGRYEEALEHFGKALERDPNEHPVLQLLVSSGKGRCFLAQGYPEAAVEELEKALERAEAMDSDPLRSEVLHALYRAEKAADRPERALERLERYQACREKVLKASEKDRIRCQEQAFQAEKKEKEAEIQRLRNVELKEAYEALEEKNREIRDSLNYASRIQEGLLPDERELESRFSDHFILFRPRDVVSGDFYWSGTKPADTEEGERRFFVAADCTGHGVPGAFMSLLGVSFLNELVLEKGHRSPADILDKLRDQVVGTLNPSEGKEREKRADGMDLTLIAHLPQEGVLEFSGANNPLYLLRRNDEALPDAPDRTLEGESWSLYEFRTDRQPVGSSERMDPFTERRLGLVEGDRVYLLSDGYPDQFGGESGKKFKYRRLKEAILADADRPMEEQRKRLEERFHDWCEGYEQVDDVMLAGIRI